MSKEFKYFTSVITYRIPIEDGVPGNPEIMKKFTSETYAPKKKKQPAKKKEVKVENATATSEVEEW